jgi:glycosyltransferase involved in cell wall biosynthesis
LVRSKLPDHAIAAFRQVKAVLPSSELWILGDGYLKPRLQRECPNGVTFFGRVSNEEKFDLLRRAHVLLAPSVREGWGISVIEANAMGTPAVGYDVSGLRDSIVHGVTGLLVRPRDPESLADAAQRVLINTPLAERFSNSAIKWSQKFSWAVAAKEFQTLLESTAVG